jgi:hypothetical protein
LISGFFGPFHVAEMWIDGAADDFADVILWAGV